MIDYLIVIYKNYDLLNLQIKNFEKRFNRKDYRLIVIDNTPDELKNEFIFNNGIDKFIPIASVEQFDGISHGNAINAGLLHCDSDYVGIIDSDFFFLNNNISEYAHSKILQGYEAFGTEWEDGDPNGTNKFISIAPELFNNIPCCFGSFYRKELALSRDWTISPTELEINRASGFVEVGWRIRERIVSEGIKTMSWKARVDSQQICFFYDDEDLLGMHYLAGSHRRMQSANYNELSSLLNV